MPLIASAAIGAAGSLGSGIIGSKSSKSAAKKAAKANNAASRAIGTATNDANARSEQALAPYLTAGESGVNMLLAGLQPGGELRKDFFFDPMQVANTPEYQFQLEQGTRAVQQSAAARGGLFSGGTLRGLTQFSQGLASTAYQQAYNNALTTFQTNRNNLFQGLTALTGVGQNATQQLQGGLNRFVEGNIAAAKAYQGVGGAQAAGTLGAGNAWSNALQGITGTLSGYFEKKPNYNSYPVGLGPTGTGDYGPPTPAGYDPATYGVPAATGPTAATARNPFTYKATNDAYDFMGIYS